MGSHNSKGMPRGMIRVIEVKETTLEVQGTRLSPKHKPARSEQSSKKTNTKRQNSTKEKQTTIKEIAQTEHADSDTGSVFEADPDCNGVGRHPAAIDHTKTGQ